MASRKSPSHTSQSNNVNNSPIGRQKSWFPLTFTMGFNEEGELLVETPSEVGTTKTEQEEDAEKPSSTIKEDSNRTYALHAVVCQVDDGTQKNLVSLINVQRQYHVMKMAAAESPEEHQNQWYIFNDFR